MKCLCGQRAYFGVVFKKPTHCKDCKEDGMYNVCVALCKIDGCFTRATYNYKGEKHGCRCKQHILDKMVDVQHPPCVYEDCFKRPTYNDPDKKTPRYCKDHALDGMIDVANKRCKQDGCTTRPSYNKEGETSGLYCLLHARDGMVDVVNKQCAEHGCNKQPLFNKKGKVGGLFCKAHARDGMVDVVSRLCAFTGCTKHPSLNKAGEKQGIYCAEHCEDGMVNVVCKKCEHDGCEKQASYNEKGKPRGVFCATHAKSNMVDVKNKLCELCGINYASPNYKPLCAPCHHFKYPNDVRTRNYKTKEQAFTLKLAEMYPSGVLDRIISGGCSKRRPDFLLELSSWNIIVEIDENQHDSYDVECEHRRLMELFVDLGNRPLVVLRMNPDAYTAEGVNVRGCFTKEMKLNKAGFKTRLNMLVARVEHWLVTDPTKELTVEHLCFDS